MIFTCIYTGMLGETWIYCSLSLCVFVCVCLRSRSYNCKDKFVQERGAVRLWEIARFDFLLPHNWVLANESHWNFCITLCKYTCVFNAFTVLLLEVCIFWCTNTNYIHVVQLWRTVICTSGICWKHVCLIVTVLPIDIITIKSRIQYSRFSPKIEVRQLGCTA